MKNTTVFLQFNNLSLEKDHNFDSFFESQNGAKHVHLPTLYGSASEAEKIHCNKDKCAEEIGLH